MIRRTYRRQLSAAWPRSSVGASSSGDHFIHQRKLPNCCPHGLSPRHLADTPRAAAGEGLVERLVGHVVGPGGSPLGRLLLVLVGGTRRGQILADLAVAVLDDDDLGSGTFGHDGPPTRLVIAPQRHFSFSFSLSAVGFFVEPTRVKLQTLSPSWPLALRSERASEEYLSGMSGGGAIGGSPCTGSMAMTVTRYSPMWAPSPGLYVVRR